MDDDGDASPVPLQKEKDNETVESSGSGFQFCLHGMSMFLGALMRVDKMWDWECARVGTNLLRPALVLAPHIFVCSFTIAKKRRLTPTTYPLKEVERLSRFYSSTNEERTKIGGSNVGTERPRHKQDQADKQAVRQRQDDKPSQNEAPRPPPAPTRGCTKKCLFRYFHKRSRRCDLQRCFHRSET